MREIKQRIDAYIARQRKELQNHAINLVEVRTKQKYAIEAPATLPAPRNWELASSAAKVKRYDTVELTPMVAALVAAEEDLEGASSLAALPQLLTASSAQRGLVLTRYLARFAIDSGQWHAVASAAAELDALRSLALFSFESSGSYCRPEVVDTERPFLKVEKMHHPCLADNPYERLMLEPSAYA